MNNINETHAGRNPRAGNFPENVNSTSGDVKAGFDASELGFSERLISAAAGGALLYSAIARPTTLLRVGIATYLFYRAATGRCMISNYLGGHAITYPRNVNARTSITVDRPRHEIYEFWRKLENLPAFMKHLVSVERLDDKHSDWVASIPGVPIKLKWRAVIVKDKVNELIGWESIEGAPVETAGRVEFVDAGPARTDVNVTITYRAPAGLAGEKVARALTPAFEKLLLNDLQNFKMHLEQGAGLSVPA